MDPLVLRGLPLLHDEVSPRPSHARAQVDIAAPVLHPREHDVLRQDREQRRIVGRVERHRHQRQFDLGRMSVATSLRMIIAHRDPLYFRILNGDIVLLFGSIG